MRCLALAEEAVGRGWAVRLGGDLDSRAIRILSDGVPTVKVEPFPLGEAVTWLGASLETWNPDVLHLDTYWLRPEHVPRGRHILSAMQDGRFGAVEPDLAIDANLGAEDRIAAATPGHHLLGASVIPVRRQVRESRALPRTIAGDPSVLVVIGGTDPLGLTSTIVTALESITEPLRITVVTPSSQRDRIAALASASHHQIEPVEFLSDLPRVARGHHLVVSAAGTSVWDFACMGIPTALIGVADNQREGYRAAVDAGLAIGLGLPPHTDLDRRVRGLERVLTSPAHLAELANRGMATVDGLGAWRVAASWEQLADGRSRPRISDDKILSTRPATMADARMLHRWRNDPATRRASRSKDEVSRDDHLRWLSGSLSRSDRRLVVVEEDAVPVGVVRWDHKGGRDWEVSITVAPEARGQGLALPILTAGERVLSAMGTVRLLAAIHVDNPASRRLFAAAGYLPLLPAGDDGFLWTARWRVAHYSDTQGG